VGHGPDASNTVSPCTVDVQRDLLIAVRPVDRRARCFQVDAEVHLAVHDIHHHERAGDIDPRRFVIITLGLPYVIPGQASGPIPAAGGRDDAGTLLLYEVAADGVSVASRRPGRAR
jgi:hypothetical protein